jgi:hypothetical protein
MRESSLKEVKMRFFEKVLVLFVAICVSLAGFNMIASSSLCLLKMAKEAGYESMQSYPVVCDADLVKLNLSHKRHRNSRSQTLILSCHPQKHLCWKREAAILQE